ncbi:SgcJ/EcaC family oxidoreductase [Pelomonas sp. KK5]|uniref:YybH family protein n=1 Tax=Pelomonas sp. KK5 TaxID=1855730 RepID=UPI00097C531E|nr:SgcJ/EcaC family oxidoreductase [Pelomonas sp. KK5]
MDSDEQQIRALVADWMRASKAGDVDHVLGLMTEDVVFLVPGREPMRKAEFAAASRAQQGAMEIDGRSEIQEVSVSGDMAYAWSRLQVTVTPTGKPAIERKGHTLTVFRKENGRWRLARDANLLA